MGEIMLSLFLYMVKMQLIPLLSGEEEKIVTTLLVLEEMKVLISVLVLFLMVPGDGITMLILIMKLNVSLKNFTNILEFNLVGLVLLLNVMQHYKLLLVMNLSEDVMNMVSILELVVNLVMLLFTNAQIGLKLL